jgi:hypothetical protein
LPAAVLDDRLRRAFRLTLSREPSPQELAILSDFTRAQVADFTADAAAARAVAGPAFANSPQPAEAAALAAAARTLINTDNFITRE